MIKNFSNYRIGKTYYFDLLDKDGRPFTTNVAAKVTEKGGKHGKKIQLEISGQLDWYEGTQLTSSNPVKKQVVAKKPEVLSEIKKEVVVGKVVVNKQPVSLKDIKNKAMEMAFEATSQFQDTKSEKLIVLAVEHFDYKSLTKGENSEEYRMLFECVKRDLRAILIAKGYNALEELNTKTSIRKLISLIRQYLPQYHSNG
jgi:hypothetical protein